MPVLAPVAEAGEAEAVVADAAEAAAGPAAPVRTEAPGLMVSFDVSLCELAEGRGSKFDLPHFCLGAFQFPSDRQLCCPALQFASLPPGWV